MLQVDINLNVVGLLTRILKLLYLPGCVTLIKYYCNCLSNEP